MFCLSIKIIQNYRFCYQSSNTAFLKKIHLIYKFVKLNAMPEIATSEWEIVLFYNPNHPGSQKTLAYAKGEGLPLRDVDIIKNQFTGTQLEELAGRLGLPIDGLVNKEHPHYDKHYANANFDDEGWIKIMRKNPALIKEPIAIRGHKAIIVNTPSDLSRL